MTTKTKTAFEINGYPIPWSIVLKLKYKAKLEAYLIDRIFFIVAQETTGNPIPYISKGIKAGWLINKARDATDKYDPKFIDRWIESNIYKRTKPKKKTGEFIPAISRKSLPDSIGDILSGVL